MGYPFKQYGSLERYMVFLSKECKERGHRAFIHFDSDSMPYNDQYVRDVYEAGGEIVGFPMNGSHDVKYLFKMRRLIKEKNIQVVHSYFSPGCHFASWAAFICGVKGIFRTIGSMPYTHKVKFRSYAVIRQKLMAFPLTNTITVCKAIKKEYTSYFKINQNKVRVIYGGTDIDKYKPHFGSKVEKLRKEFSISKDEKVIGTIADLEPRKGHRYLLGAMPYIFDKIPNVKLVLIGDGTLWDRLQATCKKLGIMNHTIFTGIKNDVDDILHLFDVFVLPSIWGEGLSAAILEAMAVAKPVVATDIGGSSEVVDHGRTGFIVPAKDSDALAKAIVEILKDKKIVLGMGVEGRKIVKRRFDLRIRAKAEIGLYENLKQGNS